MPQNNRNEELKQQFEEINSIRRSGNVHANWFHPNLTGRGTSNAGHFNINNALIRNYLNNKVLRLHINEPHALSRKFDEINRDIEHIFDVNPNLYQTPNEFVKQGDFLLTSVLPQFVKYGTSALIGSEHSFTFPLSSLFDTNNNDRSFTKMYQNTSNDTELFGKIVYQDLALYQKTTFMANDEIARDRVVLPSTFLQLLIKPTNSNDSTTVVVTSPANIGNEITTNTAYLLTIPLDIFEYQNEDDNRTLDLDIHYVGNQAIIDEFINSKDFGLTEDEQTELLKDIVDTASIPVMLDIQANHIIKHYLDDTLIFLQSCINIIEKTNETATNRNNGTATTRGHAVSYIVERMARQVKYVDKLREYDESLIKTSHLQRIYALLSENIEIISAPAISYIAKQSLQLLLSQRLHDIDTLHQNNELFALDNIDEAVLNEFLNSDEYSDQQKQIITTTEPLVIGQAGAGTGKSHTLIGRIKYLEQQGIDLSKILVLSFTNIAAENIVNRFAGIKSETLANMFNQIYHSNYPTQTLSEPTTLANAIRLLSPRANIFSSYESDFVNRFLKEFARTISNFDQRGFRKVDLQLTTKNVAKLIEENLELTEITLNAIEQTTLELQPIIIHARMMSDANAIHIPSAYSNIDFIITDESQDTSTFEYVLLLELVLHHKSQLLIVGDGSQNLYEFRNSNPRYLNALEASDVFTSYKLDVNYRSNDEILCFANQFLQVIEANEFATIQLQTDQENRATVDSFKDAVTIQNVAIHSTDKQDLRNGIENFLTSDENFKEWLTTKITSGEQVALLASTRDEVSLCEDVLNTFLDEMNIEERVVNILQNNERPDTIISDILMKSHYSLKLIDIYTLNNGPRDYENRIIEFMENNVDTKFRYASENQREYFKSIIRRAVRKVTNQPRYRVIKQDVVENNKSSSILLGHISRELIRYETAKNAIENSIKRTKEVPDYENAKIVVSTIHGSKGLEFDNTIVLYNESRNNAMSQESFRALFVALSRAKSAEYILNLRSRQRNVTEDECAICNMFIAPMHTAYKRALLAIEQTT